MVGHCPILSYKNLIFGVKSADLSIVFFSLNVFSEWEKRILKEFFGKGFEIKWFPYNYP